MFIFNMHVITKVVSRSLEFCIKYWDQTLVDLAITKLFVKAIFSLENDQNFRKVTHVC
jgi:hypothetical protein